MDRVLWKSWRQKLELFDAHGRTDFAAEEREGARLKARFFAFCAPHGRVLDLGCGTGYNRKFVSRAEQYLGIDPLQLTPHYQFPFIRAVGEYLPWKAGSFDSVICIATLDHVADPRLILKECHRVLRPGGALGIMTKVEFEGTGMTRWLLYLRVGFRKLIHGNLSGFVRGLREVLTGEEDAFHMHHFSQASLQSLCGELFENISVRTVGNVLFLRGCKGVQSAGTEPAVESLTDRTPSC